MMGENVPKYHRFGEKLHIPFVFVAFINSEAFISLVHGMEWRQKWNIKDEIMNCLSGWKTEDVADRHHQKPMVCIFSPNKMV